MRTTRVLITVAVVGLLVLLVVREVHHWSQFRWSVFWQHTRSIHLGYAALSFALINSAILLRALRWKLLLWPHRTSFRRLLPPTFIGFTGLSLLGRAGEFVRPYLIARNEDLPISSQLGVWTVERIFDLAAFTALLAWVFASGSGLQALPHVNQLRRVGLLLIVAVAVLAVAAVALYRHGGSWSRGLERLLTPLAPGAARRLGTITADFGHGARSLGNATTMLGVAALSLLVWAMIACGYLAAMHAFPPPLGAMPYGAAVILVGFSIAGGLVQLPGGSTSQLIVIAALVDVLQVPSELAVSCGILLWICAYMAPVPFGLLLLRRKHLSLRGLSRQSRSQDVRPAAV